MVTGRVPFDADTPFAIVLKHINEPLPPPRQYCADLPENIERLLLKSLAKNPDDRFQTAEEFSKALRQHALADRTPTSISTSAARATPMPPAQETRVVPDTSDASQPVRVAPLPETPGSKKGLPRWLMVVGGLFLFVCLCFGMLVVIGRNSEPQADANTTVPTVVQEEQPPAPEQPAPDDDEDAHPNDEAATVAAALATGQERCPPLDCPDPEGAITAYNQALETHPENTQLLAARGRAYLLLDAHTHAEDAWEDSEQALEHDPENALAHLVRGRVLEIQSWEDEDSDPKKVLADYDRAIQYNPDLIEAHLARAAFLGNEEGLGNINRVLEDVPGHPYALMVRAGIYRQMERFDDAIDDYATILATDTRNEAARLERSLLFAQLRNWEEAKKDISILIDLAPDDGTYRMFRGFMALVSGQPEDALNDFQAALDLEGDEYVPARYGQGVARLRLNQADQALDDLEFAADHEDDLYMIYDLFLMGIRRSTSIWRVLSLK
ncbi:MAG: tetratricopeptide repeat protein [Chloroflexaceae bacterium]|nr:tetratricopeptide repeat protein [Chloroflexaceae bacterium]